MIKRFLKNVAIGIGIFAASMALTEGVLFAVAHSYRMRASRATPISTKEEPGLSILCLGDSFTFGMGAEKGYSYPQQLESMLNQQSQRRCVVYNGGLPGNTSSKLLKELENSLRKYKPDICLVLIGANDSRHIQDINYFYPAANPLVRGVHSLWRAALAHSRVCRAIDFGWKSYLAGLWKRRLCRKHALLLRRASRCATSEPRDSQAGMAEESRMHLRRAENYFNAHIRNVQEALSCCRKAVEVWPQNTAAYLLMAQIYMGQDKATPEHIDTAIRLLEEAIAICPKPDFLNYLWDAYFMRGRFPEAREALEMYLSLKPDSIGRFMHILRWGFPPSDEHKTIKKVINANLREAITVMRKRGIKVMLQNYPHEDNWAFFLSDVAKAYNVPFVDHRTVFKQFELMPGYQKGDYFAKDGHCNRRGYGVMAENLCQALKKEGWLAGQ